MSTYNESPYKNIPNELIKQYTLNNTIPILNWWLDGRNDLHNTIWEDSYINSFKTRFTPLNIINNKQGKEPYIKASYMLYTGFLKYNINNINVAVIGSTSPWIEAILLNLNNYGKKM